MPGGTAIRRRLARLREALKLMVKHHRANHQNNNLLMRRLRGEMDGDDREYVKALIKARAALDGDGRRTVRIATAGGRHQNCSVTGRLGVLGWALPVAPERNALFDGQRPVEPVPAFRHKHDAPANGRHFVNGGLDGAGGVAFVAETPVIGEGISVGR